MAPVPVVQQPQTPPPPPIATPPVADAPFICGACGIPFKGSRVYRHFHHEHPHLKIECSPCEYQRKAACAAEAGLRKKIELEQREAVAKARAEKNEAVRAAALHRTAAAQEASWRWRGRQP